jgi:23S rRNA pseudouridine2605 synthase
VKHTDDVRYNGEQLRNERKVYLVLNKPKDYVTTTDDPKERKTVMLLLENAGKERIYPVGRLDRNTTGVLLFTNDGDLAKKLTHPSYNKKKIYHVFLDKAFSSGDMDKMAGGMNLEDGFIQPDAISYASKENKREVGLEIHSGRNRIVRRMFESLGYRVNKLDRVYFAGLTKKDLPRGKWRFLTEKEVSRLKMNAYE